MDFNGGARYLTRKHQAHLLCSAMSKRFYHTISLRIDTDLSLFIIDLSYCRASQEWRWHIIVFTIAKYYNYLYILLDLATIDRSIVY